MIYDLLKKCVSIFFNLLNTLLGGKLPPFGSACVIVEQDEQFLAIELPGKRIVFPGGFMNWLEQPHEGAEREGREETGLQIRTTRLVGYYSQITKSWKAMSTISFVFAAEVVGGELHASEEGQPRWVTEEELRQRMSAHSLSILDDYLLQNGRQHGRKASIKLLPRVS